VAGDTPRLAAISASLSPRVTDRATAHWAPVTPAAPGWPARWRTAPPSRRGVRPGTARRRVRHGWRASPSNRSSHASAEAQTESRTAATAQARCSRPIDAGTVATPPRPMEQA
jgi:hypothetical protein